MVNLNLNPNYQVNKEGRRSDGKGITTRQQSDTANNRFGEGLKPKCEKVKSVFQSISEPPAFFPLPSAFLAQRGKKELFLGTIFFGGGIYLAISDPLLIGLIFIVSVTLFSANSLIGNKIKFWQIAGLITTLLIFFSLFHSPAQAIFLENLENFLVDLASQSGSTVDADGINLIFNLIRAIFLILVVVAALFAYNQAQQGNDWRPIAGQGAMAFGIIIAIDVITQLFVGA